MTDSTPGGFGDFVAWCLDIAPYLGTTGTHAYETTETAFSNGGVLLGDAGLSRIASVFNANYGSDVTSTANNSAAFQLALRESVYDTDQQTTFARLHMLTGQSAIRRLRRPIASISNAVGKSNSPAGNGMGSIAVTRIS
ncbi:hypothetical protein DFP92_101648 [Yoonia sediminilitoris]|uniref:Uncharacterized protein n=1 Tax=Yoonia sediminilitoris TaxID=1286148 RepID=A0A2T6KR79_9RHOB|nr:hypothetical protein C8N45_101648 [Yoonia sediminilitoris]RCW99225.1 hypothetical protein DFP92_101648 [Yoonia sediminilitoris]